MSRTAWLIFFALIFFTLISEKLDLAIAHFFFDLGKEKGTLFINNAFTSFIYRYGVLPAKLTAYCSALIWIASFTRWGSLSLRKPAFYLGLTLLLGSGMISNALFKDHWGRPRPKEIIQFGGKEPFASFYQPRFNTEDKDKSFPSGHATCGFYFLAVYYLGKKRRSKRTQSLGIFLTLVLGGALSFTRMAQGGHFFSDVLFSFFIMWATSALLASYLFSQVQKQSRQNISPA